MAANPVPMEYVTAEYLAQGTEQVPRDLLTGAALGRFYIVQRPDGTELPLTSGSLAYQRPEIRTMSWQWSLGETAWGSPLSTSANATKGCAFTPAFADRFHAVRFVFTTVAGAQYKASHGWVNGSNVIQDIAFSPVWLAPTSGHQVVQFDLAGTLVATQRNFLAVTRTDGAATYALPIFTTAAQRWLYPATASTAMAIASLAPPIGATIVVGAVNIAAPVGFLTDT